MSFLLAMGNSTLPSNQSLPLWPPPGMPLLWSPVCQGDPMSGSQLEFFGAEHVSLTLDAEERES